MDGYGQFCPIALGAEIFAQRWTPLILREVLLGSHRFSEIQRGLPRISRNLLVQRLETLEEAGIIERRRRPDGRGFDYYPTIAGEELRPVVHALGVWGYKWTARDLKENNLDAGLLMWFLRRRVRTEELPPEKFVTQFDLRAGTSSTVIAEEQSFWLVLDKPDVELCLSDPGFEIGLVVRAEVSALTKVFLGTVSLPQALRNGTVELSGRRDLRRGFSAWLGISAFAPTLPAPRQVAVRA